MVLFCERSLPKWIVKGLAGQGNRPDPIRLRLGTLRLSVPCRTGNQGRAHVQDLRHWREGAPFRLAVRADFPLKRCNLVQYTDGLAFIMPTAIQTTGPILMIPLIGYADRLSLRPGETINFKVSSTSTEPYAARLVRIICGDPNPAGPGIKEEIVPAVFAGQYPSRSQHAALGSYATVDMGGRTLDSFTLVATIWPTLPNRPDQGLIGRYDAERREGVALSIGPNGAALCLAGETSFEFSTGKPFRGRAWYRVWASYDAQSGIVRVGQKPLGPPSFADDAGVAERAVQSGLKTRLNAPLLIAAIGGTPVCGHFNGKIEAPALYAVASCPENLAGESPLAAWDFSTDMSSMRISDTGPNGLHGMLINAPARAMTGSNWTGEERNWRHAPESYGAIHFHEDELADCGWDTDFSFTVPDTLRSGAYAARLACGDHWEAIPFFVCPARGTRQADLCVLVSTFTYTIYGNQARVDFGEAWTQRAKEWGAFPWNPREHRQYGLSTYNHHTDGSGICHASWHRPMFNVRPGYFPITDKNGSGPAASACRYPSDGLARGKGYRLRYRYRLGTASGGG